MYSVYKLTLPDGRAYVGMTSQVLYKRWQYGAGYSTNDAFYEAIHFYGWKNIQKEVLEEHADKTTALMREKYFIGLYKTYLPEYGFNTHGRPEIEITKDKYKYVCVELNLEFNTLEEAGAFAGVCKEAIRQAIIKGRKCGKGQKFHFIKVKICNSDESVL